MKNLFKLHEYGISFSLDDFGTGYSNVRRLGILPISVVKIDRLFVLDYKNEIIKVIIKNMIKMFKELDLQILIEGIESKEQLEEFIKFGCDYVQGFFFSMPLKYEDFIYYIDSVNSKGIGYTSIVTKDSIVNVDYVGQLNGVPFEGGTAKGVWIDVANNSDAESGSKYIDGFANGVLGARVGDSADYDITFPENYGNANLAGKHVVFTFTINSIAKDVSANFTDAYVKEHSSYTSAAQLYDEAKKQVEEELSASKNEAISAKVQETVLKNCQVKSLPEGLVDTRVQGYIEMYKETYKKAGQDFEQSIKNDYKLSMSEFEQQLRQEIEESLRESIVFEAIAKQENITVDDQGFTEYAGKLMSKNNLGSLDELYEKYGTTAKDVEGGMKYLKNIYLCNKALELCVNSAVVNEK